jgi:hypothetical protein
VKCWFLAVALGLCLGAPAAASALVTPASTAPPGQRLALVLPLRAQSSALARFAQRVSTPGSASYGQYRSVAWLSRHFGASARGHYTAPATPVMIPRELRGTVTGVIGLDNRAVVAAPELAPASRDGGTTTSPCGGGSGGTGVGATGAAPDTCASTSSGYSGPDGAPQGCEGGLSTDGFAPNEYLDAYQFQPLHNVNVRGQGERVALVEIDGFRNSDIRRFAACFDLPVPPIQTFAVGVPRPLSPGGEATLDLEVLDAAASRLKAISVYEAAPDAAHVLRALTAPLQSSGFKPDVISVSLGLCESDTVAAVGKAGVAATESALQEANAAGISVLGASGDGGSAGCIGKSSTDNTPLPHLAVTYPASSPWVTAIGGTNFDLSPQNQISSQVVWNDGSAQPGLAGGGGFSTLFTRPKYQDGVVTQSQRALPDLALLADVAPGYDVFCTAQADCNGRGWTTFGGTSAATPLLAGGFALIDQLLREHSLQPLGLANPLLYKLAQTPPGGTLVIYDVAQGGDDVGPFIQSDFQPLGCCSAATGFDEASGWGGIDLSQFAVDAQAAQGKLAAVTMTVPSHQHPFASLGVVVKVHCNAGCDVRARAKVTIQHMMPVIDYSRFVHIRAGTTATVKIAFTDAQVNSLATAIEFYRHVTVAVTAAMVDPDGTIERQTATTTLPITS